MILWTKSALYVKFIIILHTQYLVPAGLNLSEYEKTLIAKWP